MNDDESTVSLIKGCKNLIVCFGGMVLKFGGIPPFEFLRYLSSIDIDSDLIYFRDLNHCWYHKGLKGITSDVDETVLHLKEVIQKYDKVVFMGVSSGGYASILFGSLCKVDHVIAFNPQTILRDPINKKYINLKCVINDTTKYILFGNPNVEDFDHHILQCENIEDFPNVQVTRFDEFTVPRLRDSGFIRELIDRVLAE